MTQFLSYSATPPACRRVAAGLTAALLVALVGFVPVAKADDRHDDHRDRRHDDYRHHRDGGYYPPPPVVYGGAPYYYGQPPVVYAPGIGINVPGLSIGIH